MLCRIRNASDCSASVMPASMLTSTDRTAADAFSRLRRPRGVSRVGRTFPAGACAGLVTWPSRSRGLEQHVHRLPCHERAARELGVRQARPLSRQFHATGVQAVHDALVADGHTIVSAPIDGPFGRTFTFAGPDGYHVTLHDRA